MIKRFICAGSLNVDMTFRVDRMPEEHEKLRCADAIWSCGGSAANTAYWLARLGAHVHMVGCVGDDPAGIACTSELAAAGVNVSRVRRVPGVATGIAAIFVNPTSKRMVTSGGANALLDFDVSLEGLYGQDAHLHVATPFLEPALRLLRQAKANGASTSGDMDCRLSRDLIARLDIAFVNHTDLCKWYGRGKPAAIWREIAAGSSCLLVVTQGEAGAAAAGPRGECFVPAPPVRVVDRTGGGDAFDAGFLTALSAGGDLEICLGRGLSLASKVISHPGSRPVAVDLNG